MTLYKRLHHHFSFAHTMKYRLSSKVSFHDLTLKCLCIMQFKWQSWSSQLITTCWLQTDSSFLQKQFISRMILFSSETATTHTSSPLSPLMCHHVLKQESVVECRSLWCTRACHKGVIDWLIINVYPVRLSYWLKMCSCSYQYVLFFVFFVHIVTDERRKWLTLFIYDLADCSYRS